MGDASVSLDKKCEFSKTIKDKDAISVAKALCKMNEIISSKGAGYGVEVFREAGIEVEPKQLMPVFKYANPEEPSARKSPLDSSVDHTFIRPELFPRFMADWDSISFVGKIFDGEKGVVYFRPKIKGKNAPVHSFGVIRGAGGDRTILPMAEYALGGMLASSYASDLIEKMQ